MRPTAAAPALLLALVFALQTSAAEPRRPGQESFLTRAAFAEGRLWLLSDAGDLSSIVAGGDARDDRAALETEMTPSDALLRFLSGALHEKTPSSPSSCRPTRRGW